VRLAPLFRYPEGPPSIEPGDADLDAFAREMSALSIAEQQSAYTATFDLAPSCTPYLGVHLFGDENPDRARLMVGLRLAYRRMGIENDGELPDHVAEVLAFAERDDVDERDDLRRLVLVPALTKMKAILEPTANPYRHLVVAALHQVSSGGPS
jgi:nitrate reductase molybdenum cofactor assembly chaperone NarJ/NarW